MVMVTSCGRLGHREALWVSFFDDDDGNENDPVYARIFDLRKITVYQYFVSRYSLFQPVSSRRMHIP